MLGRSNNVSHTYYSILITSVLDMLRFNKFTIGAAWVPEFGNPDDGDDFKFLYKYIYILLM